MVRVLEQPLILPLKQDLILVPVLHSWTRMACLCTYVSTMYISTYLPTVPVPDTESLKAREKVSF